MYGLALSLVIVASLLSVNGVDDGSWADGVWNEASVQLYSPRNYKYVGAMNLCQPKLPDVQPRVEMLGHIWGLPKGEYFALVHNRTNDAFTEPCGSLGPQQEIYDDNLNVSRPLILFMENSLEVNHNEFQRTLTTVSLRPGDKNYVMELFISIYPKTWDEFGPLNTYFQKGGPVPLACGLVVPGFIEHHIYTTPQKPEYLK